MDLSHDLDVMEQIRVALLKPQASRSYDDLLLLKSYITKTELITKDLAGIVSPRQMNDICRSLGMETYDQGQVVFHQGDIGDKVYIVLQGKCDVRVKYKIDLTQGQSEVREKYIITYTAGQFFGERALQFDEPRSATVTALEISHLVTIHKSIYMSVLNEAKKDISLNLKIEQFGTKDGVIKILSKVREKRTSQELDAVASYIYRRIPFFQKFTLQQLVELCRVAETVTIWGRSILFRQGQIGQAFYVILSGTVEVWVNEGQYQHTTINSKKAHDLTEGMGAKVNNLVSGDVFGERALENESSLRMASIITGEDSTDLLVISKEDYHNLVYVMMHSDSMHKLQLLRKTELFSSLDVIHLRALARFLEPKKFQINEELATAGRRATEIIIIEKGECRVITEVTEGYDQAAIEAEKKPQHHHYMDQLPVHDEEHPNPTSTVVISHHEVIPDTPPQHDFSTEHNHRLKKKNKKKQLEELQTVDILGLSTKDLKKNTALIPLKGTNDEIPSPESKKIRKLTKFVGGEMVPRKKKLDLGRIAPSSVIAPYVVFADAVQLDILHPETIVASTLVSAYTISKHDFFSHVAKDSKAAVVKLVRNYKAPVLAPLWENVPRALDDNQWKMEKTWEKFRTDFTSSNKEANILDSLKSVTKLHMTITSTMDENKMKKGELEVLQRPLVTMDWGLPLGSSHADTGRKTPMASSRPESPTQFALMEQDEPLVKSLSVSSMIDASTVSNIIRKRLNQAHAQEAHLKATNNTGSLDPLAHVSPLKQKNQSTSNKQPRLVELPFIMVQIHREYSRANPSGAIEQGRRMLKSYLRVCGAFPSIAKAKEMADKQLEHLFLTLYQSNISLQDDLLLNWNTFKGFESIPVNDSDHFLIYCRSSPMEYASIYPKKNILFSPYPAICKLANQRYCVTVMNQIIPDENPLIQNTAFIKKKRQIVIGSKVKGKKEVMIGLAGGDGDEEVFDANNPNEIVSDEEEQEESSKTSKGSKSVPMRRMSTFSGSNSAAAAPTAAVNNSSKGIKKEVPPIAPPPSTTTAPAAIPQSESAVTLPEFIGTKKSSWPLYLQELSAVYENLVVTTSRLDSVRYAINRFGTMPSEILSRSASNTLLSTAMMTSSTNGGTNQPEITSAPPAGSNLPNPLHHSSSNIQLKALSEANKADRILRVIHNEQKKICIVPLFKWILLNEETIETLNFLNSFKETTVRKILLAEELDQNQEDEDEDACEFDDEGNLIEKKSDWELPTEYRDIISDLQEKHLDPDMIKSFSEAGFITSDPLRGMNVKALDEGLARSQSSHGKITRSNGILFIDNGKTNNNGNNKINTIVDQARALKILEKEIESKEMFKQIHAMQSQFMTGQTAGSSFKMANTTVSSFTDEDFVGPSSTQGNTRSKSQKDSVQLELRLKSLNRSVKETGRILSTHDQLCDLEHGSPPRKDDESSNYQAPNESKKDQRIDHVSPKPHKKVISKDDRLKLSRDNKSGIMKERLNVIESLQKMQFPSSKSSGGSNGNQTAPSTADASVSANATVSALFGLGKSPSQGSGTQNTAAGRRLAESLRILSESLDSQMK